MKLNKMTFFTLAFVLMAIVVSIVPVNACTHLKSSMLPTNANAYPKEGSWEPAKLGYYTSNSSAKKTYKKTTDWKAVCKDYLYTTTKTGSKKTYTKYKRIHWEKYCYNYTKGSKKYTKDLKAKVTLTKVGTTASKPGSTYKSWYTIIKK